MNKTLKQYAMSPQMMMPWHPGKTVTTTRAAELLGCSPSSVLMLIQDGRLEAFKRRRRKNSPFNVIYESVLRVSEEWHTETGAAPVDGRSESTRGTGSAEPAHKKQSSRS